MKQQAELHQLEHAMPLTAELQLSKQGVEPAGCGASQVGHIPAELYKLCCLAGDLEHAFEDTADHMSDSDHDTADHSPPNILNSPRASVVHSRLGQVSLGSAVEETAAAGAAVASSHYSSPGFGRVAVPRLGLSAISPGNSPLQPAPQQRLAEPGRTQATELQQGSVAGSSNSQRMNRQPQAAERGASSSAAASIGNPSSGDTGAAVSLAEGQRGVSYPEDELLDGTCAELMRVKMERDSYRSEIEVLKNQVKNQEQTITMLSGYVMLEQCIWLPCM